MLQLRPLDQRMQEPLNITQSMDEARDDAQLMSRIATGDQRALQALMQRHLGRTVRLAARVLGSTAAAEDVAQEAFIRVWKHADRWETPEEAGAKFSTWLYRIVLNLCIDEKRKKTFGNIDDIPEQPDSGPNAEKSLQQQEQSARVRAALGTLPERQRAAFVLCFYEDFSNREAADMLGISVKALESLLVRARKTLRELLQGEHDGTIEENGG
jgi:RNA polymerase sigma-70 factor (ECF subfamily)